MSGRRMSGSSRPSLGVQFLPSFPSFPRENRSSKNVWEDTWKSQTSFLQTSAAFWVLADVPCTHISSKILSLQCCPGRRKLWNNFWYCWAPKPRTRAHSLKPSFCFPWIETFRGATEPFQPDLPLAPTPSERVPPDLILTRCRPDSDLKSAFSGSKSGRNQVQIRSGGVCGGSGWNGSVAPRKVPTLGGLPQPQAKNYNVQLKIACRRL